MGFICPNLDCLGNKTVFSRKDLKDEGLTFSMRCPRACCGALLRKQEDIEVVDSATTSRKSLDSAKPKCLCWHKSYGLARCPKHQGVAPVQTVSFGDEEVFTLVTPTPVAPATKSKSAPSAPLLKKQNCDVVVAMGPPVDLEFVYPALCGKGSAPTTKAVKKSSAEVLLEKRAAYQAKHAVPTPGPVRVVKTAATPVKVEKIQFPRGAVVYNGTNFFDAKGNVVLSAAALKILRGVKRLRSQAVRAERRQRICKKIRLAAFAAKVPELLRRASEATSGGFRYNDLNAPKCADSVARPRFSRKGKKTKSVQCTARSASPVQEEINWDDWIIPESERTASPVKEEKTKQPLVPLSLGFGWWRPASGKLWTQVVHCMRAVKGTPIAVPCEKFLCAAGADDTALSVWARISSSVVDLAAHYSFDILLENYTALEGCTMDELQSVAVQLDSEYQEMGPPTHHTCGLSSWARGAGKLMADFITPSLNAMKGAANAVIDRAYLLTKDVIDGIFSQLKKLFYDSFGHLLGHLNVLLSTVDSFWQRASTWVMNILEKTHDAIKVLRDASVWSLLLILVGGMILLSERFLVSVGVITQPGTILGIFLATFLGIFGYTFFKKDDTLVSDLLWVFKTAITGLFRTKPGPPGSPIIIDGDVVIPEPATSMSTCSLLGGLDIAIAAIGSVGSSILTFKMGTLQYAAKIATCLDQLRKGKDVLKEMTCWLIETLGQLWNKVTGREATFFDEVSAIVAVDIREWLQESQDLCLAAQTFSIGDKIVLEQCERLIADGHKLLRGMGDADRKLSASFLSTIQRKVSDLEKIHTQSVRAGYFEGRRMEPFWVYIHGPSHCGKSLLMEPMSRELLKAGGFSEASIYTKNSCDKYWSRYRRQACVQIDDLSAGKTDPSLETQLINLVASKEVPLDMAEVEDKGILFDSSILVTSSNTSSVPTNANINHVSAYNNRQGCIIMCRQKPEYNPLGVELEGTFQPFDPRNPQASVECMLQRWEKDILIPVTGWISAGAAMAEAVNKFRLHREKEMILQNNHLSSFRPAHPIYTECATFLSMYSRDASFVPPVDLGCKWNVPTGYLSIAAVDGRTFGFTQFGVCEEISHILKYTEEMEAYTLEKFAPTITRTLASQSRYKLVGAFLKGMVRDEDNVMSLKSLGPKSTSTQREFFETLGIGERVYLRAVQKRINKINNEPAFNVDNLHAKLLNSVVSSYEYVKEKGPKIFPLLMGFIVVVFACYGFVMPLLSFASGGSAVGGMVAMEQMTAASVISSGSSPVHHRSRAPPIQPRYARHRLAGSAPDESYAYEELMVVLYVDSTIAPVVNAVRGPGRSIFITEHQAMAIPNNSTVVAHLSTKDVVEIHWEHSVAMKGKVKETEIVQYRCPSIPELPARLRGYFEYDLERDLPGPFTLRASVYRMKSPGKIDLELVDWTNHDAELKTKALVISDPFGEDRYRREYPRYISYRRSAQLHDCGAICVAQIGGQYRVVGLLISTDKYNTGVGLLPSALHMTTCSLTYVPEEWEDAPRGLKKLGWKHVSELPHMPRKTQYELVNESIRIPFENPKIPSVLVADDPRTIGTPVEGQDPVLKAMEKFYEPMLNFDETPVANSTEMAIFESVCDDIVQTWYDAGADFEDVDDDVVINGDDEFDKLIMDTSEGYPYVLERSRGEKGKTRYFEGGPGAYTLKPGTSVYRDYHTLQEEVSVEGGIPEMVCIECPKDELLVPRKVLEKLGTRNFEILELPKNMLFRKKFLSWASFLSEMRWCLPCQVGIVVQGREWGLLLDRLSEKNSVAYNCDYSKFDGLMSCQVLDAIGKMVNKCYANTNPNKKGRGEVPGSPPQLARHNLLMSIFGRKCLARSQVFEVRGGIPSGCALTVLLNSVFNEILIRYVYKTVVPSPEFNRFETFVTLAVYGDDNLIAVDPVMANAFTGEVIKRTLARKGITITDGSDKLSPTLEAKPLSQLDFLKRSFLVSSSGQVMPALDRTCIYSSLLYLSSKGADPIPLLHQNVQNALQEMYHRQDRAEFDTLRNFYLERCPTWRSGPNRLLDYNQCHAHWISRYTGQPNSNPAGVVDMLVDPRHKSFLLPAGPANWSMPVADGIFVCGPKFFPNAPSFTICFNRLAAGETGIEIKPVHAATQGAMPTGKFVKSFRSMKKRPELELALAAKDAGSAIYFKGCAPYNDIWACAIAFCSAFGFADKQVLLAVHDNSKPIGASSLRSYFNGNLAGDGCARRLEVHSKAGQFAAVQRLAPTMQCKQIVYDPDFASKPTTHLRKCTDHGTDGGKALYIVQGLGVTAAKLVCTDLCDGHVVSCSNNFDRMVKDVLSQSCF
uniref:RNA1 polyprotein n=2 Tax=Potato black ringspot virus TaxID=257464 RepID=U5XJS4_9SECO|nr:RNA 1 polyprotein [Potato black ringspot virus]QVX32634.1 polyprotein 1 [Potato black ringspot virus]